MKIKNKLATILIFLLAVSQQQYAQAATFELGTDQSGYTFIKVSGSIEPGDGQTFAYKVKSWADQGKPVQIVVLNSIGGRVQEAYYIYKTVLNYRINTIVLPSNVCLVMPLIS
ncbi:hypothetical protein JBO44_16015 [Enterobacter asburiae]|uniref:hypothetical protein n=1 Tax=Enterobacter asburiae TaxID=61645 RepID=UPI00192B978A|nr:hypothetical protein [Enterobacter asburiae]MBL5945159.1 hypothetical protein [Enterobacter asburiae]MBL5953476.1 hypothetical protein [Enterobacter asburiae]